MVKEKWRVRFRVPALAYANGPVARVLTVVVRGSVVGGSVVGLALGVAVVGVVVVTLASAPGQPVRLHRPRRQGRHSKTDTPFLFHREIFTLLRFTSCKVELAG